MSQDPELEREGAGERESEAGGEAAREALRRTIHRVNNDLAVLRAYAETALAKDDPALHRRALEMLLSRSTEIEEFLREMRRARSGGN